MKITKIDQIKEIYAQNYTKPRNDIVRMVVRQLKISSRKCTSSGELCS